MARDLFDRDARPKRTPRDLVADHETRDVRELYERHWKALGGDVAELPWNKENRGVAD